MLSRRVAEAWTRVKEANTTKTRARVELLLSSCKWLGGRERLSTVRFIMGGKEEETAKWRGDGGGNVVRGDVSTRLRGGCGWRGREKVNGWMESEG